MNVSIPPRFGVSPAAVVTTQRKAPRQAAANPDVLFISSLHLPALHIAPLARSGMQFGNVKRTYGDGKKVTVSCAIRPADGGYHARLMSRDFGTSLLNKGVSQMARPA
jgi:hypothetical protein